MNHNIQYLNWTFGPDQIREGNLYLVTSLLNSSLEVNVLSATVECDDRAILDFERNTPLSYYTQPDRHMIFRVQSIKRAGPETYSISATSTLGLLSEGLHYGGIYTGQTAQEVIADICGTVPFVVKSNLEGIKLYGWLPIASPRDNLAQVLFAIGAALKTDLDGVLRIEGLWDGISGTVTRNGMYTEASVEYDGKVTQVIVSEHQFVPWTEEKQLFEGTAQAGDIITFDEPMHSLKADGFSIQASGANWARVSAGSGVLSGKTYLHNTRQITKDVWPAKEPNVKTVKEATLVSLVNSQACAQRMADYYRCRERVDAPVVYHGELPGDRLATYHPFDRTATDACLESADITLSNTLKAQEKSLVGFVPPQIERAVTYDHHEVLTGSGTWVIPEGVTKVLAVLIGGGGAGFDGKSGTSATGNGGANGRKTNSATNGGDSRATISTSVSSSTSGTTSTGKGGAGGSSGTPGKVYQIEIEVENKASIQYSCGTNGESDGATGGETYFGDVSSASGTVSIGYTDVVSGITYALPGSRGANGGDGGSAGSDGQPDGDTLGGAGLPGISDTPTKYMSSMSTAGSGYCTNLRSSHNISLGGAGGGGAGGSSGDTKGTAGKSGYRGRANYDLSSIYSSGERYRPWAYTTFGPSYGGKGGNGANGKSGETLGSAGSGGGGGGGGGAIGASTVSVSFSAEVPKNGRIEVTADTTDNDGGTGGTGGTGGAGAPGCIILYYGVQKKEQSGQFVDKYGRMVLDRLRRRIIV